MSESLKKVRKHLIDSSGKISQDIGVGRILGQVMTCIYLNSKPTSLDDIAIELHLSKAAVSIATRQLDKLGLIKQIWVKGDRKTYYQTSNHLAATFQKGFLDILRKKLLMTDEILKEAENLIEDASVGDEKVFMSDQIGRARKIHDKIDGIINSTLFKFIGG
jgi:DNA-binding transcriptional regulator GbsR (MarR family)